MSRTIFYSYWQALVALLLLGSCSFVSSPPEQKFTIGSYPGMWAVEVYASGTFKILPNEIEIGIPEISLVRPHSETQYQGGAFVESIQIGLATDIGGAWDVRFWGGAHYVDKNLLRGESLRLPSYETKIDIPEGLDLSQYWFVIKIDVNDPITGHGTTFAHSEKGIFNAN